MWLLTTRNRPEMCQQVLDACIRTGVSTNGVVWMDGCDYGVLRMPDGWMAVAHPEHLNIGEIMRRFQKTEPNLPWYGWMADDCIPISEGWDVELVKAAGRTEVAYPDDAWQQGKKEGHGQPHVTSIVCMGGEFVRALGEWVLPGFIQMYIDDYWESVAVPASRMKYCPHVKSEHRHFANGKRQEDETDNRAFNGEWIPHHDLQIYSAWMASEDRAKALQRVMQC